MVQCTHTPMGISSRFPMASQPLTNPFSPSRSRSTEGNEKLMKLDLNFFAHVPRGTCLGSIVAALTDG